MKCPNCSQEIADNSRFCEKCGKKIPRCPKCDSFISERTRFCIYDGTRLPEEVLALIPQEQDPEIAVYEAAVKKNLAEIFQSENNTNIVTDQNQQVHRSFCVRCGQVCDKGQMLCRTCQVKALNVPKKEPEPIKDESQNILPIVIIIIILLLMLLVGTVAVVAVTQGWFSGTPAREVQSTTDDDNADDEADDGETDDSSTEAEAGSEVDEEPVIIYPQDTAEDYDTTDYAEGRKETQETTEETIGYFDVTKENAVKTDETKSVTNFSTAEKTTVSDEPEIEIVHSYEIISADLSWEDAKKACEQKGGHLATITSQDEYERICDLADTSGLKYLWLGAALENDEEDWGSISWITGERWTYSRWYPGEPSLEDQDGTKENCLCLWNARYDDVDMGWTFNDQRNNLVEEYPSCSGMVGYVCEYETEVKTWKKN